MLSPLLGPIAAEWHLDEVQLGLIASVFYASYTLVQVPTGLLADRLGKKSLIVTSFLLAGLALVLRGLAPSYGLFLAAGAFTGVAQGIYYAPHFSLASAAIPRARRGIGSAFIYSGTSIGGAIGLIFGSLITFRLGLPWRAAFLLLAVPSVIAGVVIGLLVREPSAAEGADSRADPGVSEGSIAVAGPGEGAPPRPGAVSIRAAFSPRLVAVYAINFTSLYAFFMVLSWLPYYLQYERGFSGTAAGLVSSLVPWASIAGGLIFAAISDRAGNRLGPLRFLLPAAGLAVAAVGLVRSPVLLCVILALYGLIGKSAAEPLIVSGTYELAPPQRAATALGFLNFFGMIASVVSPCVTGLITRASGSMLPALFLAGAVLLLGAVIYHLAFRAARPAGAALSSKPRAPNFTL